VSTTTTIYTMTTDEAKTKESSPVRIYADKKPRLEKVRRYQAAAEDRDLSEIGLLDEILEEGLSKREHKLGIIKS
jgi:hypothetical protein